MPPRRRRIPVVFDTNVIVGFYLGRNPRSATHQAFRTWRDQRLLQLIISDEVLQEYLEVLSRLTVPPQLISRLEARFARRKSVTRVNLGTRHNLSRDPDDNIMIATARSGKARFLVTNDHDLLDISAAEQARLRLLILTPAEFVVRIRRK